MEKKVTTIPATLNYFTSEITISPKKRRVAGYARVSTDNEDQLTSYEAQIDYYTNYIKSRNDWEFAGIYTDEGISGTSTKRREGFRTMIADAKAGKIDLIVTKSVSRFARNTVDSLTIIRELKDMGIEIYFEKENILTLDSKGELLITIMSSIAQEESRSISENVTWGQRKRFADGKVSFAYSQVLGFYKGADGQILVNQEQAKIVKIIFRMFLEGMSPHSIARKLTEMKIKSPAGKEKWSYNTVRRMLSNEKYKGDALLQKEFTVDFLQKKTKKNEGEVPQYYVEGNHEAIISPEVFDLVQAELEKRKRKKGSRYSGISIFSNKIKCGCCGSWFGSKVWHSTDKYKRVVYRCNHKYDSKKCNTGHITENEIKAIFVRAFNLLIVEKREILSNLELVMKTVSDTTKLIEEKDDLIEKMGSIVERTQNCVNQNAKKIQNQHEYQKRYNELTEQYDNIKDRYDEVIYEIKQKNAHAEKIRQFIEVLKLNESLISEFDEALWGSMVEYITVESEKRTVTFKDGTVLTI